MRTTQAVLLVVTLFTAGTAHAADANPMDVLAADFALNVCGAVVGDDPARLAASVKKFPTAILEKPALLPDSLPGGRAALADLLHVDPVTPVHRVVFKPQTGNPIVVAFVRPDLKGCETILFGKSKASDLVSEQLRKADSGWNEINTPTADEHAWQRKNAQGIVVTFTTGGGDASSSLGATTLVDTLLPTLAQFDAFADAVVRNCVKVTLSDAKPDPAPFLAHFNAEPGNPDGSILLMSKEEVPGGRLLLIPAKHGTACMLAVDKTIFSFDFYRRALGDAFLRLPGATREDKPDLFWVFTDPVTKKTALMSNRVEDKHGMLIVAIEREE